MILITFTASVQRIFSAEDIQIISWPPTQDIARADVYYLKTDHPVAAVLVLCPGDNDNGLPLVQDNAWQEFAAQQGIGLMGISYASDPSDLAKNRGYYTAKDLSGTYLIKAIKTAYGTNLPILLYGYSGGAHFISNFVEWAPHKVLAWCAYSAAWWNDPGPDTLGPPGIVVCGEFDATRYTASLNFFQKGRRLGKLWTWVSLPKTGHEISGQLEDFARKYFASILTSPQPAGIWYDIATKAPKDKANAMDYPSLTCWLPTAEVAKAWKNLHAP